MEFAKVKDFMVCVDSDGCAMDTMNYKHIKCFGPLACEEWEIKNTEKFLDLWNYINLYSATRGVNRFKGLVLALNQMREFESGIEDISQIEQWVDHAASLSNNSLIAEIEAKKEDISPDKLAQLEKALKWSHKVNQEISALEGEDKPFEGVKEALENISKNCHIAIVSSANLEAINGEWRRHGLMDSVDLVFGQDEGSKADCIKKILDYGFEKDKLVMVGDSPGDLKAAEDNGVLFFPILFGKEDVSWGELIKEGKSRLLEGRYQGEYNQKVKNEFLAHLKGEKL